jgi:hypothetical protein
MIDNRRLFNVEYVHNLQHGSSGVEYLADMNMSGLAGFGRAAS